MSDAFKFLNGFADEIHAEVEYYWPRLKQKAEELDVMVDEVANKRAEELFEAKKEEHKLEVIREFNAANLAEKGAELSNSPYMSKTVIVNGKELCGKDFISNVPLRDPDYNGDKLIYSDSLQIWQKLKRNGDRKLVSDFVVTVVAIINASGLGQCEAFVVCLENVGKPLIFDKGKITTSSLKQQTTFCKRGVGTSDKDYYDSFVRAIERCPNAYFLSIPKHSGGNFLQGGVYDYTSRSSVMPGLERLYPAEILNHQLMNTNRSFEVIIADYHANLAVGWKAKLCVAVRVMSILLPFYETEGLKPDRCFVFTPSRENDKNLIIALTSRFDYVTPILTSATSRINIIREALAVGNDMVTMLTYSACENNMRAFQNTLDEIHRFVSGENGFESSTRRVIGLITDIPGSIPENYPAYYLPLAEKAETVDKKLLLKLSGELDYRLIQILIKNTDAMRQWVHKIVSEAKEFARKYSNTEQSLTMIMLIATSKLLQAIGLISDTERRTICSWLCTEAVSRATLTDEICREFQIALRNAILSGEIKVAKQVGPPFYKEDGHTVFIANEDRSINIDSTTLKMVILPRITLVNSVAQLNKHISGNGWMIETHSKKRKLMITFKTGESEQIDVFSYNNCILTAKARAFVGDIIDNEFWLDPGQLPKGFVPVLQNADGTKFAGYVLSDETDINRHEANFGISRSGKSFGLLQTALIRALLGEKVIIFDQSGSFTEKEIKRHIGQDLMCQYISQWDVYQNGLPVNLIDLRGCQSKKEMKERITRLYAVMLRCLGDNEERILRTSISKMLSDHKDTPEFDLSKIVEYIKNAKDVYGEPLRNDSHRNLLFKLEEVLEDLEESPLSRYNWGEFIETQHKPIIVISTGLDSTGKSTELIDAMIENLYQYKQQYSDVRLTVVLDELQDLYLHEKGAINTMIRKIGKDSVSVLAASQAFPEHTIQLGKSIGNCGRIRGYRPKSDDLGKAAKFFGCDVQEMNSLRTGECFDNGIYYSRHRKENINATLKGKPVTYKSISNMMK